MKYVCSSCGAEFLKWSGKCSSCDEWGTLEEVEEVALAQGIKGSPIKASDYRELVKYNSKTSSKDSGSHVSTGYGELDRVLGKGLIQGEVVLLSGEPGVGKSTLLMQVVLKFCKNGKVLYICGEESPSQLHSRLERLGGNDSEKYLKNFIVTEDTIVENILALLEKEHFDLVVVDSIQSVSSMLSKGYPGSISQVRLSGALFTRLAKNKGIPIFIVGQINKGGDIAGPKVLEHIVDCVLYMEGDQYNQYRIIRSMKNRFGSTNEIGVFEMRSTGLEEVGNPSLLFLESDSDSSGSAIGAVLQGSRVVFVEVQALVVKRESEMGPLRRVANGIRKPRLDMLCAVLSRKGGLFLGDKDVFVNVVGGLNVNDPSIDLAVCSAIKSSIKDVSVPRDVIYFGEVGLTGEVRGMWGIDAVISEAERAGYKELVVGRMKVGKTKGLSIKKMQKVASL
ncbi:MAG: DNA repair protein RadA [Candidatus Dojkabacteria bacterium]